MMSSRRKLRGIVAVILGCGLAAIVAVSTSGASDAASSPAGVAHSSGAMKMSALPTMPSFEQASLYPVLTQVITAQDAELKASAEVMAASGAEEKEPIVMEPDQVREIGSASGVDVGIMPAAKGLCILASPVPGEVTGSCSPLESLELSGLNVGFALGDQYFQIGALPSNWGKKVSAVTGNGDQESVTTNEDGFYALVTAEPLAELVVTDEEGVERLVLKNGKADSPAAVNGG